MSQSVTTSECPNVMTLTMYVSGSLVEHAAKELSGHLELCGRCQQLVDDMAAEPDSLIKALRRSPAQTAGRDSELDRLIVDAEKFDPERAVSSRRRRSTGTVTVEAFIDYLCKSELFSTAEVDEAVESIAATDSTSFAREMIARKQLTPFQAKALMRGRWKGLVLGNYIVLDKLGQGGMGLVFKARHKRMERIVCLKVLDSSGRKSPEILDRFRKEAQTVAALNHSNIVVAHDAGEADGIPFLVMEYVQGSDLAKYVSQHGPLAVETVVPLVLQVAQALDYAHSEGVIHRDVKPHNLLLEDSGTVKILDMGLARFDSYLGHSPDATTHASMTTTGIVMGTVDYMSPEQALNSRNADNRSDVYSLGCTLFFLLTGGVLYDGETVMEKLVAHREQKIPSLADACEDVPAALDAIFRKMVDKETDARYQSMSELADDLQAFLQGDEPAAAMRTAVLDAEATDLTRFAPSLPRRALPWSALVLAVAMVAGVAYWMTRPSVSPVTGGSELAGSNEAGASTPTKKKPPQAKKKLPQAKQELPKGHPKTFINGGPGRVLVVVPHDWFYEDHFLSVTNALRRRGIDMQTASSKPGNANPKHKKIKPVPMSVLLEDFDVLDFDAVIFLGGNIGEFTHKGPAGSQARRIIRESLNQRRVVASLSDGWKALNDAGVIKDCKFSPSRGCNVGRVKGLPGTVITTDDPQRSFDLVALIFDEVLRK